MHWVRPRCTHEACTSHLTLIPPMPDPSTSNSSRESLIGLDDVCANTDALITAGIQLPDTSKGTVKVAVVARNLAESATQNVQPNTSTGNASRKATTNHHVYTNTNAPVTQVSSLS